MLNNIPTFRANCRAWRRLIAAGAMAAMLTAALACTAGCGDEGNEGEILLRAADWGSPAVESEFMARERRLRETFEKQHPGVRVREEQIPGFGQYAPKLIMMYVAGCAPDVMALDAASGALFIDNGVLRDLMPYVAADKDFTTSLFFENTLAMARRGKALYAIPLDFTPMVMYYNKAIFDEAGVPYPKDGWAWDDFLSTCRALTVFPEGAPRPTRYGYNFENVMPFWVLWLWTNGGSVLGPEGKRASGYFDSPASIQAIQFLTDLMLKYHVAPTPAERAALGGDPFLNGLAAMDLKGHWMLIDYRARGLDVGVTTLPTNIGRPVTVIYETGLAITKDCQHPELAWEYIKYMTSKKVQVQRVATGLAISANRQAAAEYAGNPVEDAFLKAIDYARPPRGAKVERYPLCEEFGREMMEDILYGSTDVEHAVKKATRLMDAVLAE